VAAISPVRVRVRQQPLRRLHGLVRPACPQDVKVERLPVEVGPAFEVGWLGYPLTVFWFVGFMNAINLIDGLDGLASGIAAIAAGGFIAVGIIIALFYSVYLAFRQYRFYQRWERRIALLLHLEEELLDQ